MSDYGGKCSVCGKFEIGRIHGLCLECDKKQPAIIKSKIPVITNDYIKGYIAALKTVQENLDHRINMLEGMLDEGLVGYDGLENRKNELISIKSHTNQLYESYKQLVKELNSGTKSKKTE